MTVGEGIPKRGEIAKAVGATDCSIVNREAEGSEGSLVEKDSRFQNGDRGKLFVRCC